MTRSPLSAVQKSREDGERPEPGQSSPVSSEEGGEIKGQEETVGDPGATDAPPLPDEPIPPLPADSPSDDGWEPLWDSNAQAYYFYNRFTKASQWENPRVPQATPSGLGKHDRIGDRSPGTGTTIDSGRPTQRPHGGYNPAIHGDYDPTAPYAQEAQQVEGLVDEGDTKSDPAALYAQSGSFNRWNGKWQSDDINPENHNDENKSRRQMSAFFDVDAAANSHDGRSLKAERSGKKLSKAEVKAFKEKRKERKEEKRRAWLRD